MRKPPHTIVHHNQLWCRLYVPDDVRAAIGKKLFLAKVGDWPMPFAAGNAISAAMVAQWKQQIAAARQRPIAVNIEALVAALETSLAPAFQVPDTVDGLRARAEAVLGFVRDKSANGQQDVPFVHFIDEWQRKTHLKGKTLDQASSDVRSFGAGRTLAMTGADVQAWIEDSLKAASAATVRRKLTAVRSYWQWLLANERVPVDRNPFIGRSVKDHRTAVEAALAKRQRFEAGDVLRLIEAAADDPPLQALIRLAAWTGARREGLASLKAESVVRIGDVECLRLAEKSAAGVRDVPIHPSIQGLVRQLVRDSSDGFLIDSNADKHGHRGDVLGKRFTRLKTGLGFGSQHTFHSIRHTVVSMFRHAGCPLEVRNQIIGHEDGSDVGAGAHYGGEITPKLKLEWIKRAIQYS